MFQELPEEYRPAACPLPVVRRIDQAEVDNFVSNVSTAGYMFFSGQLFAVFAEAKHVEFVDLFTGHLCFPPDRFFIPLFKSMAKANGPFAAILQHGFRTAGRYPYRFSAEQTGDFDTRNLHLMELLYAPGFAGQHEWRVKYTRKACRALGVERWNADASCGTGSANIAWMRTNQVPLLLKTSAEYLIYQETDNADDI